MTNDLLNAARLLPRLQNEVHVWLCRNDVMLSSRQIQSQLSVLSEDERHRYHRFHFDADRHAYLLSHTLVRNTLSRYIDVSPECWVFEQNAHGKPSIAGDQAASGLQFNLSHTRGLSACVIAQNRICGVDVENLARHNNLQAIAQRMFADAELETLSGLDDASMRDAFFRYWTLREAYVKALGTGLSGSSRSFYFTLPEHDGATIAARLHHVSDEIEADTWRFQCWSPDDNFMAAVAFKTTTDAQPAIVTQMLQT